MTYHIISNITNKLKNNTFAVSRYLISRYNTDLKIEGDIYDLQDLANFLQSSIKFKIKILILRLERLKIE